MYAGVGTTNSVSNENDSNSADIPEWKKLLIMKKRAGNLAGGDEKTRSHLRGPVTSNNDSRSNVNIARNGGGGNTGDNFASGYANKFNVGRVVKTAEHDSRESESSRTTTPLAGSSQELPPKTITRTIGNINVELRSVPQKSSSEFQEIIDGPKLEKSSYSALSETYSVVQESDDDACEDLQYGPGIVDRLRSKFLNMGAKKQGKPVVRRFSSLENLPVSNAGPYRVNAARGFRQNGIRSSGGYYHSSGNVKKAQSMETLLSSTPEQQIIAANRRPNARYTGVKGRIMAKNISPICIFTDENYEPSDKSPSPTVSPKPDVSHRSGTNKSNRRWDYTRSSSAPNINEDELPKPDTVRQFKKMFESPPANAEKQNVNNVTSTRFRKISNSSTISVTPPTSAIKTTTCNGAILGNNAHPVQALEAQSCSNSNEEYVETAKSNGAKELNDPGEADCVIITTSGEVPKDVLSPEVDDYEPYEINKSDYNPAMEDDLSANRPRDSPGTLNEVDNVFPTRKFEREESEESFVESTLESPTAGVKVIAEQLPLVEVKEVEAVVDEALFQGSREVTDGPEQNPVDVEDEKEAPHPLSAEQTIGGVMVVASAAAAASDPHGGDFKKPWQTKKPPQTTTSIVFDFRGKDVKPNISLNPAPFGCRPAKVSRGSMRAGSPPRGVADPSAGTKVNGVNDKDYLEDEDDDWDEMDIGADLPAISGIVFDGENVKVGRGALLEIRNKKLSIQFDDRATSTFEYPSESPSSSPSSTPSPMEENGRWMMMDQELPSLKSPIAISSPANYRLGLSNYTPHGLSSSEDFELGISRPNNRHSSPTPMKCQPAEDVPTTDEIVPANPDDTAGWSATETADILF